MSQPYEDLEVAFAEWNGLDPATMVACASGTAALHLAIAALRLPSGAEVIQPEFSMVAVPLATKYAECVPVFVDCNAADLLIDPDHVDEAVGRDAAMALVCVHVYGRRCDMDALAMLAVKHYPLYLIEDLAEAHGVRPHPDTDAACWSFQSSKVIHGEEGGAVWFREAGHARLARSLRCMGFTEDWDYRHEPGGHNYRMSNAHAGLILDSLAGVASNVARRRAIEAEYDRLCPAAWRMPPRLCPWNHDIRVPGLTREGQAKLIGELNAAGVAARHGFYPMSGQKGLTECLTLPRGCPRAWRAADEVLTLPLAPSRVRPDTCRRAFEVAAATLGQGGEGAPR